jgi:predicted signal transduction protein with EAL and GGDEF domain
MTRRGQEDAQALAQRLLERLAAPIEVAGTQVHCGCSIGISLHPRDGTAADQLMHHADLALYKAKESGRNAFCFFISSMNEEAQKRRVIEDDLRSALNGDALSLNFQPQVELATGRLVGLEALLRWKHPEKGFISPGVFIPVAERCGLILAIDRWVLRQACLQAKRWVDEGLLTERIAVNVSAMQLSRADLMDDLVAVLRETGLPARHLEIEITESVLLTDTDVVARQLAAVNDLGVWLSVDDFGTGYSSLTYLRRFPVQKVKIDTSFVRDVCTDANDASIACAIISLGHSLGLRVVAEGIETREQFEYLRDAGCDEAQGYYIARPMAVQDCEVFLRQHAGAVSLASEAAGRRRRTGTR